MSCIENLMLNCPALSLGGQATAWEGSPGRSLCLTKSSACGRLWQFVCSCVQLFATPWTVAHQAPLSMEFSRQEYWSGLPFPSPLPFNPASSLEKGDALSSPLPLDSLSPRFFRGQPKVSLSAPGPPPPAPWTLALISLLECL